MFEWLEVPGMREWHCIRHGEKTICAIIPGQPKGWHVYIDYAGQGIRFATSGDLAEAKRDAEQTLKGIGYV